MAITGIDTIDGKQIIAAGAVSAKSAEMAYNDENGNPITGYLTAVPEGYATTADLTGKQDTLTFGYNESNAISSINESAIAGGSYQPSGNYIPYTAIDGNAFKTNSGLKIATFIGSELRTNFINNNFITLQSVNSTLGINNQVILATGSLTLKTKSDSAYVDREKIHKWDSASDYIQNNSAALNEVSAKLDTTAFSTVSGDFYTTANESGFITGAPAGTMNESAFEYDASNNITAYNGSAIGGGSAPTYGYTDNGLISAIDTSGLYATSALEAKSANILNKNGVIGAGAYFADKSQANHNVMILNPTTTPFSVTSGIYSPLQYAAGAVTTYGSSSYNTQYFGGFLKGNEWYVSNATAGQALRGEVHKTRGVHISGATTAGYGFDLNISGISGKNDTANNYNWILQRGYVSGKGAYGEWYYGAAEDAALRAVSSCDMHESAFEYDANDKISGYNGSAFAGGSDVPEGVMVESGLEYNAVNEISGYNGSAITQYGAEKQWLVHDDTLVHAANSAQYALGVNLSAVEKLSTQDLQPKVGEETFAGYWNNNLVYQRIVIMPFSSNGNTTAAIPSDLYLSAVDLGRRWIDVGQSWIHYGSENISLPITWFLGAGRQGCVSLISNSLAYRGVDNANTGCTAYICLKYRKKQS